MAHRPQGVAASWQFAIQRNSDAIHLNNMHEITDLLAPNDPGKLYSAIERKAAGWAVMDADTRLNEGSAGTGKGAKGDHKGAHSATIPCKHSAKGTFARWDKCRFSHKSSDSKSGGQGNKGKKSSSERDRCKKCGKITNPPLWARSCPQNSSPSAQVVLTSAPVSSPRIGTTWSGYPCEQQCKFGKCGGSGSDFERCLVSRWIF